MNKKFKKFLTLIVVFSMIAGMGVSFASNTYTPTLSLTISGNSTNNHTSAELAWMDSSGNLYIAVQSTHTMSTTMTLDGTINSSSSIELIAGQDLKLDGIEHAPNTGVQGNKNDSRWTIYIFNSSLLTSGTKLIVAYGIGGGHDLSGQSITIPENQVPTYTLTINYVYENETVASPQYTEELEKDEVYSVTSPSISGYTADKLIVSGTMGTADVTVEVVYTKDQEPDPTTYTLTINYVYENETVASPQYTEELEEDEVYSVTSPLISGYTADKLIVSGTMGTTDVTVEVVYTEDEEPVQPPIIITTVTTYEVNFLTGEGGSLEGITEITTVAGTVWSLIDVPTPVADEGYEFVEWDNEFPTNIYQDWTFTARFRAIDNEEIIDDEEIPEVTPEPEVDKEEPEDTVVIDDEETPEVTPQPTLPATSYASTGLITGLGVALMGLGFALRKRYK